MYALYAISMVRKGVDYRTFFEVKMKEETLLGGLGGGDGKALSFPTTDLLKR